MSRRQVGAAPSIDEVDEVMRRVQDNATRHHRSTPDLYDALLLVLHHRLRLVEVVALTWDRVHLDAAPPWLVIDRELSEDAFALRPLTGGVRREIEMHHQVAEMLLRRSQRSRWTGADDAVFATAETVPGRGRTGMASWLRPSNLRTRLRTVLTGTGLQRIDAAAIAAAPVSDADGA